MSCFPLLFCIDPSGEEPVWYKGKWGRISEQLKGGSLGSTGRRPGWGRQGLLYHRQDLWSSKIQSAPRRKSWLSEKQLFFWPLQMHKTDPHGRVRLGCLRARLRWWTRGHLNGVRSLLEVLPEAIPRRSLKRNERRCLLYNSDLRSYSQTSFLFCVW